MISHFMIDRNLWPDIVCLKILSQKQRLWYNLLLTTLLQQAISRKKVNILSLLKCIKTLDG